MPDFVKFAILLSIASMSFACSPKTQQSLQSVPANEKPLVSGPMLGYVEHREALIWLETHPQIRQISIKYRPKGSAGAFMEQTADNQCIYNNYCPLKIVLPNLEMDTQYEYELHLDGVKQKFDFPLAFRTKRLWEHREDPPEFSFVMGSCAYFNDTPSDRPGKPYGQETAIFEALRQQPSDFMLWLGDNTYYREVDWSSPSGIYYRNQRDRSHPDLHELFASRPHYAIWDDHDFGPNDSNYSYELKETTLAAFRQYWGNKSYGEAENAGIYGKFTWGDAEFFLLDNRYHRSHDKLPDEVNGKPNPNKHHFGERQLEWLKNGLLSSNATFKFIVSGGQILNTVNKYESLHHYKYEYDELLSFITDRKINGVLFLSGDRHLTEINRITPDGFYTLYDITSSPYRRARLPVFPKPTTTTTPCV